MKAFSKFLTAALAAGSLAAIAAPAQASVTINFAQYQQIPATDNVAWTKTGATSGTLTDLGDTTVLFRIWDTIISDPVDVLASMDLNAQVDNTAAIPLPGGQLYQGGLYGSFSFTALSAFTLNSINYAAGTNLLSAVFTNGSIMGRGTGSVDGDELVGAIISYTSAVIDTSDFFAESFVFSLNANHPAISANPGESINSFSSTTTGQFAAAVPEPATWALMIAGFGGAGLMIRARRRQGVLA